MIGATVEEAEDEPLFAGRVAGTGIGKKEIMVTIRVPGGTRPGGRQQETRSFGTTRRQLLALADWLRSWQVTKAGMEAAGDYWKPVYFLLEREGFDCDLYHAAQVRALPGRPKTGKLDSVWLAKITERGALRSSFVPPEEIRRLRACTRYRRHLTRARTAEKQRAEKLLEDAHLKLPGVISDIHGASGRDMLNAIIAGQRDPKVLAQLARRRMRRKITELEQALDCSFVSDEHVFILQMMLATIGSLTARIDEVTAKIEVLCEPYEHQIGQLCTTPGTDVITAQDITGEIGVDMTVFPAAGHLASRARRAPQVRASGGKRKGKNATGQGNPCFGAAAGEAAISAGRTQAFPGAKYRRLRKHMPKKKAQVATGRSVITIWHALLSDPAATCTDPGAGYYERRMNIRRQVRSHARAIERHGCKVTIEPLGPDPETGELPVTIAS
jgi:transposase